MDIRIIFDVTPALGSALHDLAEGLRAAGAARAQAVTAAPCEKAAEIAPQCVETAQVNNPPAEAENAPQMEASREPQAEMPKEEPVPVEAVEAPDELAAPVEKPKRGRPKKAPESRVEAVSEVDSKLPAEAESAPQMEASREPQAETLQAVDPTPEPEPVPTKTDDPYCGMSLLQAVQKILELSAERGQELADVNARVRKACAERGLNYPSATTLVKAIGYTEAAAIALGEK